MLLSIRIREVHDVSILDIAGYVSVRAAGSLVSQVKQLLAAGKKNILLNLEGAWSSEGLLGALIAVHLSAHKTGGCLKLLKPRKSLREALTVARIGSFPTLESLFEVFEDESEALLGFKQSSGK